MAMPSAPALRRIVPGVTAHVSLFERRVRHLALSNLAIDSELRGCDVVEIRIDNVAPNGYTLDRTTIWQDDADEYFWLIRSWVTSYGSLICCSKNYFL
jgi:hypothetical protein